MYVLFWFIVHVLHDFASSSVTPFVILPPFFRIDAINTVVITPAKVKYDNVDIHIVITGLKEDSSSSAVLNQKLRVKRAGAAHTVSFHLHDTIKKAKVSINIQGHDKFEHEIRVRPNVAIIHIHTDKPIYSPGETVSIRALPLTYEGSVFDGIVEFALMNPHGFDLVRKQNRTSDGYIALTFVLPKHLFYGQWRIVARPMPVQDPDLTYGVEFSVKDYVLPSFKIIAAISEGQPLASTRVSIEARYYHGAPVSGSLVLYCSLQKRHFNESRPLQILQSQNKITVVPDWNIERVTNSVPRLLWLRDKECTYIEPIPHDAPMSNIVDGLWQEPVNMTVCFTDDRRQAARILVQIRDHGTGNRGESLILFDPLVPGFEIVPLRPVFNSRTKYIQITTHPISTPLGSELNVIFKCLGDTKRPPIHLQTTVGEVLSVENPTNWNKCSLIMVEAVRNVGKMVSRTKVLLLPNMEGVTSLEPSWIEVPSLRGSYSVGDRLQATVPKRVARSLNYLVICNSRSIVTTGQVRDDGALIIKVTSAMVGHCALFVYSMDAKATADMVQFHVKDRCEVSLFSSRDNIKPGSTVTITMNGEPHGIAFLRAIDDRLTTLKTVSDAISMGFWDFGALYRPGLREEHAKLINLFSPNDVKKALEKTCSSAATYYVQQYGHCPEVKISSSTLSNYCSGIMTSTCMNSKELKVSVSTACDMKNPRSCGSPVQKATSLFERISPFRPVHSPDEGLADTLRNRCMLNVSFIFVVLLSDAMQHAEEEESLVRQLFHEVWLFEAIPLRESGTVSKTVKAPDNVGKWIISSSFWNPGQTGFCVANSVEVTSKKDVFMEIDLPKHAYINETIAAKVSVTALKPTMEHQYSVCFSETSRKVCADLGSFGQLGQPSYSRVALSPSRPTDTKIITLKFLSTGLTSVTFVLRQEASFPGMHHCEVGDVEDTVRLEINIAERVETEEIYKRIVLDADKPLLPSSLGNSLEDRTMRRDSFSIREHRSPTDVNLMVTEIHVDIPDTEVVHSFSIDVSKFLPVQVEDITGRRVRRNVEYGHSFLSDIIKSLSVELYRFKRMKMLRYVDEQTIESLENRIGSLISDMLRFSDCENQSACGYSEYSSPRKPEERSIALTAIATSLLCEASTSARTVCGGITFLIQSLLKNWLLDSIDLDGILDLGHPTDKEWFLKALLLQVSRDCAAYECVRNDEAWFNLVSSFYSLDEGWKWDIRCLASLAYMGTNATSEIMRIKLASMSNGKLLPFWSAGHYPLLKSKTSSFDEASGARKLKSGDVLVNALAILAFVSPGAERPNVDWDPLAIWLYEQQLQDGTFENAIDTYFAARALFEYRYRKIDVNKSNDLSVTISCSTCDTYKVNITGSATEIHLPTHVRNLTMKTRGHGKANVGFRILARKRQRSRRGLTQDDYYPLRLTVLQEQVSRGILHQTVCLRALSSFIATVEITHGLYTGFSTSLDNIAILPNSTSLSFVTLPTVSTFAIHFVLEGLRKGESLCYVLGIVEPKHNYEPFYLAPVAISARHPIEDLVGLALISHPDQDSRKKRTKRRAGQFEPLAHVLKRSRRAMLDDSIDTVCFQGGSCSCAESSCGVKCGRCRRDVAGDLEALLSKDDTFGALLRVKDSQKVLVGNSFYTHMSTDVREKSGRAHLKISDKLDVWLRDCNPRCNASTPAVQDRFFIIGEADALSLDTSGRQHYVLRTADRFERVTTDCGVLANAIILG